MAAQVAQKLSLQGIFAAEAGKPLSLGPREVIMGVGKSTFNILRRSEPLSLSQKKPDLRVRSPGLPLSHVAQLPVSGPHYSHLVKEDWTIAEAC